MLGKTKTSEFSTQHTRSHNAYCLMPFAYCLHAFRPCIQRYYRFISSTKFLSLAVTSTQAGLKPHVRALRTDFKLLQAAQ